MRGSERTLCRESHRARRVVRFGPWARLGCGTKRSVLPCRAAGPSLRARQKGPSRALAVGHGLPAQASRLLREPPLSAVGRRTRTRHFGRSENGAPAWHGTAKRGVPRRSAARGPPPSGSLAWRRRSGDITTPISREQRCSGTLLHRGSPCVATNLRRQPAGHNGGLALYQQSTVSAVLMSRSHTPATRWGTKTQDKPLPAEQKYWAKGSTVVYQLPGYCRRGVTRVDTLE